MAVKTAVYAAEQLYKTSVISDRLSYAEKWLRARGYNVERAQVEAAVAEMQLYRLDLAKLDATAETTIGVEGKSDE